MTPQQFNAIAELLRLRDSAAANAAYSHYVDGLSIADAAKAAGASYNGAYQAVERVQRGLDLAKIAVL